ncbi:hypothetical protein PIB30_033474 [Stylosanthes scabra]|uniref:SOSEKI DIX-like domain-containing protein n=1 Tax=Stylosanthes scabra TaxID=79078 RepID=A0ABU6XEA8_9FABA|nr:hypothetical protein [Stylosanthes scabra]
MEVGSHRDNRGRDHRDTTPDLAKMCRIQQQKQKLKPPNNTNTKSKRVHVVYYLSRNGLLEHPHYVEITLFPNDPLRLKDVFERLIALRGNGMPLQYSWSCKRNYKSGYVWCDLALNDIIHPAEGAEYILKGSELVQASSERFQQLHVSSSNNSKKQSVNPKRKSFNCSPHESDHHQTQKESIEEYEEYEEQVEEEEEFLLVEEREEERTSYTTSSTATPHSRCSRGVSTDDDHQLLLPQKGINKQKEPLEHCHPRGSSSSTSTLAEKLNQEAPNKSSKRLEEKTESSAPSRNSVLLQLIACGSSGADFKGNNDNNNEPRRVSNAGSRSACFERGTKKSMSNSSDEVEMIKYVSENPRFGNLVSEEKEYFSGSIVESIKANHTGSDLEPVLKRSNSYNQERGSIEEKFKEVEEEKREAKGGGAKGKCIPRKKSSRESKK